MVVVVVVVTGVGDVVGVVDAAPLASRPTLGTRAAPAIRAVFTRSFGTRGALAGAGVGAGVVVVATESDDDDVSVLAPVIGSSEPGGGVGGSDSNE